jgi:hypothetical protein
VETDEGTGVGEKKSGRGEDSMSRAFAGREATGRAEGQGLEKTGGKKEMMARKGKSRGRSKGSGDIECEDAARSKGVRGTESERKSDHKVLDYQNVSDLFID